jgi:branched-chain amino acid transport system permease protein
MPYTIDPKADREWVDEFRKCPVGPHSPQLRRVLNTLRGGPLAGRYVLVCTKPYREWVLARHPGARGKPFEILEQRFSSREEAEWAVFRLRWKEDTGQDLN